MSAPGGGVEVVFGRGGVRGIALAGAVSAFEDHGYRLDRVVGVSAGALVAALIAAGYRASEIRRVVWKLDYAALRDPGRFGGVPGLGPMLSLFGRLGLYSGDALLRAFQDLLADRGVRTFGDLRRRRSGRPVGWPLRVIAADVTRARIIVLPDDAPDYGVHPDDLDVALALRMSASMPVYFRPVRFGVGARASLVVDGGLLLGMPFALLDSRRTPDLPVLGVRTFVGSRDGLARDDVRGPMSLLAASYRTVLAANEVSNLTDMDAARIVDIDCGAVRAVDFGIGAADKARLYAAGRSTTMAFLRDRSTPPADPRAGGVLDLSA